MDYLTPQRRNILAANYVMGTLRGQARIRFIKLMMQHPILLETTWQWEQRLNKLTAQAPPLPPNEDTWQKITQHLGIHDDHKQ